MKKIDGQMHDSGKRQEFETGAVRDTTTGKGRFDLIATEGLKRTAKYIEKHIDKYSNKSKEDYINEAFYCYVEYISGNNTDDFIAGVSANILNYIQLVDTDNTIEISNFKLKMPIGRFDLMSPKGLMRLAKWGELGSYKYSDRNWEKGMPISRCIDSGMRHLTKLIDGLMDEDHSAAVVWNAFAVMHFEKYMPEMQDLPNWINKINKNSTIQPSEPEYDPPMRLK